VDVRSGQRASKEKPKTKTKETKSKNKETNFFVRFKAIV
jgi:hypothetical protein